MRIEKPGKYVITNEEYHSDPAPEPSISRGTIRDLLYECPFKAWFNHPRLNPNFKADEDKERFDLGSAAHSILLEGVDNVRIIDADDWRTKAAKEARELARQAGAIPLLKKQYDAVQQMVTEAYSQIYGCRELGIRDLIKDGDAEQSYFWEDDETWCRVRPDWISADKSLVLDLKTTDNSVNPGGLERHIVSMAYDIQCALYLRGVNAIEGTDPKFVFVFIETSPPYLCSFIGLPPEFMAMARQKVQWGMDLWRICLERDEWPAYPQRVAWIEPSPWALAAWERKAQEISL